MPMELCSASVVLVLRACLWIVQPDPIAELAHVRSGWPTTGVLILEYRQTNLGAEWRQELAVDFAHRSWRLIHAEDTNESTVRTRDGQILRGHYRLKPVESGVADFSALLDPYLPSFHLVGLLEHPGAFVGVDRTRPGEIHYEFRLPNGKRIQSLNQLPPKAVELQGGVDKVLKKTVFVTDEQHRPLRLCVEGMPDKNFDLADTQTGTFFVSLNCPRPRQTTTLISSRLVASGSVSFGADAMEREILAYKRKFGDARSPVDPQTSIKLPRAVDRPSVSTIFGLTRATWLAGGGLVLGVGLLAWIRRRSGGA